MRRTAVPASLFGRQKQGDVVIAACLASLGLFCHPLGDRTFDRSIQVVASADGVRVDYELGVSEITMLSELLALSDDGSFPVAAEAAATRYQELLAPILARGVVVDVEGRRTTLVPGPARHDRTDHVQFSFTFTAQARPNTGETAVDVRDENFPGERGFRRIAVRAGPGAVLTKSSAAETLAQVPLVPTWEMTPEQEDKCAAATFAFRTGPSTATSEPTPAPTTSTSGSDASAAARSPRSESDGTRLRELLARPGRGVAFWSVVLAAAFGLGMLHALKPGHGKTLVAAYLVGQQGTVKHAAILGLVTALTHTGSVLFVAMLLRPLAGTRWVEQGSIEFWLTLISGILVLGLGVSLFTRRWRGEEDLLHVHGPGGHVHLPDGSVQYLGGAAAIRTSNLLALGFSGGLVPCDDAVLLLLAAIGAGLLTQAVYILLAFSAGLAAVLVLVGILVVRIRGFAARKSSGGVWLERLQMVSAALIALTGLAITLRAFA